MRSSIFSCTALKPGKGLKIGIMSVFLILMGLASFSAAQTKLTLAEAVDRSEEYNLSIHAARYDSAAAALTFSSAQADRMPVLSLAARSSFIDETYSIETPFFSQEIGSKDNYQADIILSLPIYTGGRLSNRIGIENENYKAILQDLIATRLSSAYHCRQAYLNVLAVENTRKASESSMDRIRIIVHDVNNLFANGMADSIDVLEADLAFQKGEQQLLLQETRSSNAIVALARLIGLADGEEIILTETIRMPTEPDFPQSPGPEIDRPELIRFDHLIAAADRAAEIERSPVLQALSSFAGYSYGKPNRDWFGNTWNDNFIVGLTFDWEFNLGDKSSKRIQAAKNQAASVRMTRSRLRDALLTQRDIAVNNLDLAYRTYEIVAREFEIASRRFQLAELRQEAGQISVNRLLEMEADLTATEQQYQAAIVQYYLAENEYLYAIGSRKIFGGL
jgi:outer membrane protein TolC